MIQGNAIFVYKTRMLAVLDTYKGMNQCEQQVITDYQISFDMGARPDDLRQALEALKDDGYAARKVDDTRGKVWRITRDGRMKAAETDLEL